MVTGDLKNQSDLHFEVLPEATKRAFLKFAEVPWLKSQGWYLAGGTALALQTGHRSSVDLDFFIQQKDFDEAKLENNALSLGNWRTDSIDKGTMYGVFHKAKVSFIAYPFFHPSPIAKTFGTINLVSSDDIAVMKIIAVSQRGKKRDFVDLYWYCHNIGTLQDILARVPKQYPQEHNFSHILKSLTFFDDAEADPMPLVNFTVTWKEVKAYFLKEVPALTRTLLDLK